MKMVRRNYIVLLLLALLFAAPGLSAYFLYTHPEWLGDSRTNRGVLLNPPVLITHVGTSTERHKWQLVLWSPMACEQSCVEQLDKMARIRLALGRRLYEVRPRLLMGANTPQLSPKLVNALREQDIDLQKLSLGERENMPVLQEHLEIFIANPDDFLVLAYQPTVKPDDIFYDIKQLLNTTEKVRK